MRRNPDRADVLTMTERGRQQVALFANWFQIATMVVGFGSVVFALGQRGEQLEAARRAMEKMTATVDLLAREDAAKSKALEDIQRRLDAIERRGAGTLQQRFEELCRTLRAQGYFDEARKVPLPRLLTSTKNTSFPRRATMSPLASTLGSDHSRPVLL